MPVLPDMDAPFSFRRPPLGAWLLFGLLFVVALLLVPPVGAADGDLDLTFSGDGKATVLWDEVGDSYAQASQVVVLPDGSTVVGGDLTWTSNGFHSDWVFAKLSRSGILDSTWGESGRQRVAFDLVEGATDLLLGLFPEPDGAVLAVGTASNGSHRLPAMARFLPNGDADPAFGDSGLLYLATGPWTSSQLTFVTAKRAANGRIVLAGYCKNCPSNDSDYNLFALRLLANGSPDTSFSTDGWASWGSPDAGNDVLTALGLEPNGRIVLGIKRNGAPQLARVFSGGQFDSSFGEGGWAVPTFLGNESRIEDLVVENDRRGVVAAFWGDFGSGVTPFGGLMRFDSAGEQDSAFGSGPFALFDLEEGVKLFALSRQGDGKLLVAGSINANGAQREEFLVARTGADGDLDVTFDGNGLARYSIDRTTNGEDVAFAIALEGGRPVVAGYAFDALHEADFALIRLQNDYVFCDGFEGGNTGEWTDSAN
ncbi:MAG: hypothetical protein ABIV06_00575 [Thermoanaerobaculia bacterium]